MRDVLTVLSGLLIIALTALLAVPPLVDWGAHRALVEAAITRAVGQEVHTSGALDIRLLPTPRLRAQRLQLGSFGPNRPSLDATFLKAEIALAPLLSGEVRFLDTRIGRAEFKLPTGAAGDWRVPRHLVSERNLRRRWVFDDLQVAQFLVTTVDPMTGRTDQASAEGVRIQAASLAGPWRLEGHTGAVPFEISVGEIGPDLAAAVKIGGGGGGTLPRVDVDGRLELLPGPADTLVPRLAGTGKLVVAAAKPGPAGKPAAGPPRLPVQAQASLIAAGRLVELRDLNLEAGEGASALRLSGSGSYSVDDPRLALSLEGRRLDAAGFRVANGPALDAIMAAARDGWSVPIDLAVKLDSLGVGTADELTGFSARASLAGDRLSVAGLDVSGPGGSTLRAQGEFGLAAGAGGTAHVALSARYGGALASLAESFGFGGRWTAVLGSQSLQAKADLAVAPPVTSLRNMRVALGDTVLSGALRRTAQEAGARARIDAQIALQNLDLGRLPDGIPVLASLGDDDLGVTLDARGVGYGAARGGHVSGRLARDGDALAIEDLEVRDLAGAEASLSGRISPDGTGRIAGRLAAPRAAPLLDLFGRAWIGGLADLLPALVRTEPVDLTVGMERAGAAGSGAPSLHVTLDGRVAGGAFRAETVTAGGALRTLSARAATDRIGSWLPGGAGSGPAGPGTVTLSAERDGDGRLGLRLGADLAGVAVETRRPFRLTAGDGGVESGDARIASADLSPFLPLLGLSGALGGSGSPGGLTPPGTKVPVSLDVSLSPGASASGGSSDVNDPRAVLSGRVADIDLRAELSGRSAADLSGRVALSRLSLPWLAAALALPAPAQPPSARQVWSAARFGPPPALPFGGKVRVEATSLALAGGLSGRDASFEAALSSDGLSIRDLRAAFAGGRLTGAAEIGRQGGLASLIGEGTLENAGLPMLLGPPFTGGTLSGRLRFGASGESTAALVANLGGAGTLEIAGLRVDAADPDAPARVAARVLRSDDPLAAAKWQSLLPAELGRAALEPGPVSVNAALVAGALRVSPLRMEAAAGTWQGSLAVDLRNLTLDARGTLQSKTAPRNWPDAPPTLGIGWSGPLSGPTRTLDQAPLVNGLAAAVLGRELDRVETFDLDAAERARRNGQVEMDRQRRLQAEEAARQARLRQEAEEARRRQEAEKARQDADRARQEAEKARQDAEEARRSAERTRREAERRAAERRESGGPERASPPLDIRPPAQSGRPGPDGN